MIERVAAAKTIVDDNERVREYAELEKKIIQEDAACVPMFALNHLFVLIDRVESFAPHWAGWNDMYFDQVNLKQEEKRIMKFYMPVRVFDEKDCVKNHANELSIPHGKAVGYFLPGFLNAAPAAQRDKLLNLSGFDSVEEFSNFIIEVLGEPDIPEDLLDKTFNAVRNNSGKMTSACFSVNEEMLRDIAYGIGRKLSE